MTGARKDMKNRWLLSTACGLGLLTASASAALAQNVPTENATAPSGSGAATQTISLKPGQEAGTNTVLPADTAGNPVASMRDAHFVMQASAGGMAEVMMGQLVTDHTAADQRLMGIAQTVMLKPAPGPNAMQQSMFQQLQSAPADQFDTMFNHAMIQAHERTIALFKMEAHGGQNPQLRQFAATTLPALYKHLRTAEALSPMQSGTMSSMNTMSQGSGMNGMSSGSQGAMMAPVAGNPDNSADQLNGRELNSGNPG
jgi:putative membrane protein